MSKNAMYPGYINDEKPYIPARDPRELNVKKVIDNQSTIKESLPKALDSDKLLDEMIKNYVCQPENVETPPAKQSDWNQVDENESDYIKNRPFGRFKGDTLLQTSMELTLENGVYKGKSVNSGNGIGYTSDPFSEPLVTVLIEIPTYGIKEVYENVPMTPTYMGGGSYVYEILEGDYPFTITLDSTSYKDETNKMNSTPTIYYMQITVIDPNAISEKLISTNMIDIYELLSWLKSQGFPKVNNASTAKLGTCIVYDENNKRWQAVKAPVLVSSNGKMFRLRVSDTGALSTEAMLGSLQ